MTDGTSQGLFIVVAIVIFGIFVVMAYILFEDTLSPTLASMFTEATEVANERLENDVDLLYSSRKELNAETDDYPNYPLLYEFLQSGLDLSPIVNEHGEGDYTLEFEMKTSKDGYVRVYTMNHDSFEYYWENKTVQTTEEYKKFRLHLHVLKSNSNPGETRSMLAFWGGESYDSEVLPTVKNIKLYKGHRDSEVIE